MSDSGNDSKHDSEIYCSKCGVSLYPRGTENPFIPVCFHSQGIHVGFFYGDHCIKCGQKRPTPEIVQSGFYTSFVERRPW
jgi:hypothetical protein